jgi:hypothetical protein
VVVDSSPLKYPKVLSAEDISNLSPDDKTLVCEYIRRKGKPITDKEFDDLKEDAEASQRRKLLVESQKEACNTPSL